MRKRSSALAREGWRKCVGIEPTAAGVSQRPDGFEGRASHQTRITSVAAIVSEHVTPLTARTGYWLHNPRAQMAGRIQMRMASRAAAIAPMIDRVLDAVEPAGFTHEPLHRLRIALAEALANAVVHGNRRRARSFVSIGVDVEPRKGVTISVTDSGKGFSRESVPDPREGEALLRPRGRGVFLMRRLMDAVDYNRKGNQVRLTLRRRGRRRVA